VEAAHVASAAERQEALAGVIHKKVLSEGCRVESESEFQAVLVSGKKTNHVFHLILSVVTLGLWLPVWGIIALSGGEQRRLQWVDDSGQVFGQDIR